jgi:hypothetical protein
MLVTLGQVGRAAVLGSVILWASGARAAPPTPSGPHPRLFLSGANLAKARSNAETSGTASRAVVDRCQQTIDRPQYYTERGGAGGGVWPDAAVSCAFAYLVTQSGSYLTQAIKYWRAALNDNQTIGDGLGCVPGVSTNWQGWSGDGPAPPVIITITHDTGYPIRWYGPYVALTYDWLRDAPGVDEPLRTQTRTCLTAWIDYYSQRGYLRDEAGANYNAGFLVGKTLAAVAMGGENGANGDRMWAEVVDGLFAQLLVGKGLAGRTSALGSPVGALVGGDWAEGWQYGPLSVLEYAAATRVVEEFGAPQPALDEWTNSLIVRHIHGTVPRMDMQYVGGDFEPGTPYQNPPMNTLDAVLLGPSSGTAAGWAAKMKQLQSPASSSYIWNALAELRLTTPTDYRSQTPAPPRWYVARGTRTVYARTAWTPDAFWAVFSSLPRVVSDHWHFAAGNFVFSRGADHLVVDSSNYGEPGTLETNAVAADSPGVPGDYAPSQTPWSQAELVWARGTDTGLHVARTDFAKAFIFSGNPSDIPYARRDWTFLPEGEIVTIDRVRTAGATSFMYVNYHTNTAGTLALAGTTAAGNVGGSTVVIRPVLLSGGTPAILRPQVRNDYSFPCGACTKARFPVDAYTLKVPGPWAVAIHVIDGLASGETRPTVGSLNDDTYDPPPKRNAGVIGAAVNRGGRQSYVVASSGVDGQVGATMTYAVPGGAAAQHVVFDAPADASGRSLVTAVADGGRCAVTIQSGAGFTGRPLLFTVGTAPSGCSVTESTDVPPGSAPAGGGTPPLPSAPSITSFSATPATLPPGGGAVTLAWQVTGADSLSIDNGVGTVTGQATTVNVTADTTFTLTATNAAGSTTARASVALAMPSAPTITAFSASPVTLPPGGGAVTLSWQVSGADSLSIDSGVGTVTGQSTTVNVAANTTFTLTATNAGGSTTARASVTLGTPNAPVITSFSATPITLPAGGGTVTLAWQVSSADTVSIDRGVGTVTGTSVTVNVTASTTFTLSATNATGTSSATAGVTVAQPSPGGGPTPTPSARASGCSTGVAGTSFPVVTAMAAQWLLTRRRRLRRRGLAFPEGRTAPRSVAPGGE